MVVSKIKAVLPRELSDVWEKVTSVEDYPSWRSDLSRVQILSENQFAEYTQKGYRTVFTVTLKEPGKRWEFDIENSNMKGRWTGLFVRKGSQTEIEFTESAEAKKIFLRPFVKLYLQKQQAQFIADLRKALLL